MPNYNNSHSSIVWLGVSTIIRICINFTDNGTEEFVRGSLRIPAVNLDQSLYVSDKLKTGRVMVKDEDVCVHCGLCAERCPTGAWDIQKFSYTEAQTLNSKDKKKYKEVA